MTLLTVLLCIVLLIVMISVFKINAFLSFLVVSIIAGISLGLPLPKIAGAVEKGMGDVLGSLVIIITTGAMLGKLVAESGAAQKIAEVMMSTFGKKRIQWAMVITGFIIGIPLYYGIGFVLMVPLIFSVVYRYQLNAIYIGLPMLAALSVTHGFLPPHPSPAALVVQFEANMGLTLFYGMIVAIPAIVVGGPIFSKSLKHIEAKPLASFRTKEMPAAELPGTFDQPVYGFASCYTIGPGFFSSFVIAGRFSYFTGGRFFRKPIHCHDDCTFHRYLATGLSQGKENERYHVYLRRSDKGYCHDLIDYCRLRCFKGNPGANRGKS